MSHFLSKAKYLAAMLVLSILAAWSSDSSLNKPQYLGEIKRNEHGELVPVPVTNQSPVQTDLPKLPATTNSSSSSDKGALLPPVKNLAKSPAVSKLGATEKNSVSASNRVLRVGPMQALRTIASAAAIAKSGDTIEIDPGDYVGDVAVWTQDSLTIRGVGTTRPRLLADGKSAQGKGIWVVRGGKITVENLVFKDAKVPDRNGAGIRFEKGQLTIRNCAFLNNENGILTAPGSTSELVIENSEFGYNGYGDGQSHGMYVGAIKKLQVSGSYFHNNKEGHLLKSRASENYILYNRLTDETGGTASYELEFPSGGTAYVVGNIIQQSATTSNSTIISYGMEGYGWPVNELYLSHNTIVDDRPSGGIFLSFKPGAQKLLARNNLLVGKGDLTSRPLAGLKQKAIALAKHYLTDTPEPAPPPPQTTQMLLTNNITTDWSSFAQASRFDYRIKKEALFKMKIVEPGFANDFSLQLQREYVHPASSKGLTTKVTLPGAIQSPAVAVQ
ncbi:MAG: right-handed parallel beta-helix repeat-containing protein [Pseudomonadota bacterium]